MPKEKEAKAKAEKTDQDTPPVAKPLGPYTIMRILESHPFPGNPYFRRH